MAKRQRKVAEILQIHYNEDYESKGRTIRYSNRAGTAYGLHSAISRIEDALGIDIIQSSMNYVAGYSAKVESEPCYLSDNESPSYGSK